MDDDFSAGQNGKEKTVSGFAVTVLDSQGNPVATDKTSVKGLYEITGLVPGEYTLKVTANEGYAFTRLGDGNVIRNRTGGEGVSDPFRVELGDPHRDGYRHDSAGHGGRRCLCRSER